MSEQTISAYDGQRVTPIYSGKREDFHWVGFGSDTGTNLRECAKVIKPVLIFSDKPKAPLLSLKEFDGSVIKKATEKGKQTNTNFCEYIADFLWAQERHCGIKFDLIVLGGYMRLIKEPLLEDFPDRIINVHPADLTILTSEGKRKYVGGNAVYDALKAGETSTRSSVIIVDLVRDADKKIMADHGEIITMGNSVSIDSKFAELPEEEKRIQLKSYAKRHQEEQKRESDWPALTTALELIADGRVALGETRNHFNEWRTVYIKNHRGIFEPMPYGGLEVE